MGRGLGSWAGTCRRGQAPFRDSGLKTVLAEPFQKGELWLLPGLQQRLCLCPSGTQHQKVLGGQNREHS